MADENNQQLPPEICTIRIALPVESDEQAFELKKKISVVVADYKNAHIEFNIRPIPTKPMGM